MSPSARVFLAIGAVAAALSVALGAAGAHRLAGLPEHARSLFQTALQYHQLHALGLLATGLLADRFPGRLIRLAGGLMIAGLLLFSGNLYLRSLADFHALHAVTPWGGGAFILGWLALAAGVAIAPGRDKR